MKRPCGFARGKLRARLVGRAAGLADDAPIDGLIEHVAFR